MHLRLAILRQLSYFFHNVFCISKQQRLAILRKVVYFFPNIILSALKLWLVNLWAGVQMVNVIYFIELLPLLILLLPGHYWYVPGSPVNASMTRLPKSQCINHIYHWVYLLHWPIMQIYQLISSQQSAMHQFDLHQVVIFATEVITESAGSSNTNVNTEWLGNPIFILACFRAALVATCTFTFSCIPVKIFIFFA